MDLLNKMIEKWSPLMYMVLNRELKCIQKMGSVVFSIITNIIWKF